ncbi:CHY zinc finger protein [soil metagenome]
MVKGNLVDDHTRCTHYHSSLDIIAIKFKCCGEYYPCFYCHEEAAMHPAEKWKKSEFGTKAILCGICAEEMSILEYKSSGYHCPFCKAAFNPQCKNHDYYYFEE